MSDLTIVQVPLRGPGRIPLVFGEKIDPPFEYPEGNFWLIISEDQVGLYDSNETDEPAALMRVVERVASSRLAIQGNACLDCGRDVVHWKTDDETWLGVVKDDERVCPSCFIDRASQEGIFPNVWLVTAQGYSEDPA